MHKRHAFLRGVFLRKKRRLGQNTSSFFLSVRNEKPEPHHSAGSGFSYAHSRDCFYMYVKASIYKNLNRVSTTSIIEP